MSSSYSTSSSSSFTITHARHLAAKVATDLKRMQRLYGLPSDADIATYETEVIELLRNGYLSTVTYGFRRDGQWIEPTLRYTAADMQAGLGDDDPGKIPPGKNVSGASFYSYLTYSSSYLAMTSAEQDAFKQSLPFQRTGAPQPTVANGYFADDRSYSSGGRSLARASVRTY
ncbi:hypothetical protein [Roseateles saccharophilus]|uniref:Bacterial HORMA domain-containing protein n=1 Tax=Roseateles saccharophilus TaxID=304 RepID=A0A4R3U6U2_ROSSA|nr:hypothetical protein [Roseateles saccharophilus]MDG0836194.1 hypothetical protein [Roseateles saccharophilus]TCU81549.1 hypothetical protein EV671_10755 [Roseateles saccharophilus]